MELVKIRPIGICRLWLIVIMPGPRMDAGYDHSNIFAVISGENSGVHVVDGVSRKRVHAAGGRIWYGHTWLNWRVCPTCHSMWLWHAKSFWRWLGSEGDWIHFIHLVLSANKRAWGNFDWEGKVINEDDMFIIFIKTGEHQIEQGGGRNGGH